MSTPLPCPFCGAKPEVGRSGIMKVPAVWCPSEECGDRIEMTADTREEAIRAWNRRAPDQSAVAWEHPAFMEWLRACDASAMGAPTELSGFDRPGVTVDIWHGQAIIRWGIDEVREVTTPAELTKALDEIDDLLEAIDEDEGDEGDEEVDP